MKAVTGHIWFFLTGQARKDSPPPFLLSFRSSKTFILSACCIAVFTDIFLYGIIIPVVPFSLSVRSGIAPKDVQSWTSTLLAVYGAALLTCSPLVGWYADRTISRRFPLLVGLLVLLVATLLLCLASSIALLILGRLLQGVSAAVVWVTGCALLVDTVGEKDVGQMMGYVSISMTVGILVAPFLGGIVYAQAGYYAVYYMAFGTIALDIILRLLLIEKKIARQWQVEETGHEDIAEGNKQLGETRAEESALAEDSTSVIQPPGDLDAIEMSCDTEAQRHRSQPDLSQANSHSSVSNHRHAAPIITLLKSRRLLVALWGFVVQGSLMASFDSVLPLFVEDTFGWNSTAAGLIFLALYIPSFVAPVIGSIADTWGPRWLTFTGFALSVPLLVLLRLVDHNSIGQKVLLCALLAMIGITLTLCMGPLMAEVTYVVEAKERKTPGIFGKKGAYAQAYGLFVTAWATGATLGPLLAGFVRNHSGWGTMAWALALLGGSSAIPCLLWTGGSIFDGVTVGNHRGIEVAAAVRSQQTEGEV